MPKHSLSCTLQLERLSCVGHVVRENENVIPKKDHAEQLYGRSRVGRLKLW